MRASGRRTGLVGVALGAFFSTAVGSWAQPPGSIPPFYSQRLRVPVRGDDFAQPRAVVADPHTGEIFVCDSLRSRVVIFDEKGRFRYQIPGGSAFQAPIDLAVDSQGYLFVLGQVSAEITMLDFDGRLIRRMPLAGLPEDAENPRYTSIAISSNDERLFLMDSVNHRLWITDRDGAIRGSVDMTTGRPEEQIKQLRYGHVDVYGDTVLIPIPTDGLVHLFDLEGRARGTIGTPGTAECQTMFPVAAALDDEGKVIILDQQRALFMTWDLERGVCLTEHYGFGNAPGAFYQPGDLALDTAGRLYVSQGFEGRIQVYEGAPPASMQLAARLLSPEDAGEPAIGGVATAESDLSEPRADTAGGPAPAEQAKRPPAPADTSAGPVASEPQPETEVLVTIEQTVLAWAEAWSSKRIDEYLAFYSEGFDTGPELSRSDWEALRRLRLDRPRSIQVSLARVDSRLTAEDRAKVAFVQTYRSNLFADKVDKILILRREESGWKILAERVVRSHRQPSPEASEEPSIVDVGLGERGAVPESPAVEEPTVAPVLEPAPTPPTAVPALPEEPVVATIEVKALELGALLVAGARLSVDRVPRYDPTYSEIAYPEGDLPLDRGASVDVVVRAFRHAGIDLQEAVHRDISVDPGAYGIDEPDPGIDHRRIRNLVAFFERRGTSLSTEPDGDWAPGDLVFWDRDSDGVAGHVGVLTDQTGPSGRLLVVHHHRPTDEFPGTPSAADVLLRWPVVGHYRWSFETESHSE